MIKLKCRTDGLLSMCQTGKVLKICDRQDQELTATFCIYSYIYVHYEYGCKTYLSVLTLFKIFLNKATALLLANQMP